MTKPVFGVTAFYDRDKNQAYMTKNVLYCLERMGAVGLTLPFVDEVNDDLFEAILDRLDGVLFTGGTDLPPSLYGEENRGQVQEAASSRDKVELGILPHIIKRGMPALGICRGMQLFNVYHGGTMYQDLREDCPHVGLNHDHDVEPYNHLIHKVQGRGNPRVKELFGQESFRVNSIHHQAVRDLGSGLEALVWSEDGLIESLHKPDYPFLVGVQWHPEILYKEEGAHRRILENFVQAGKNFRIQDKKGA